MSENIKDIILNEIEIAVNTDNEVDYNKLRQKVNTAKRNPNAILMKQKMEIEKKNRMLRADSSNPIARIELRIQALKKQMMALQRQKDMLKKRNVKMQESEENMDELVYELFEYEHGPCDCCDELVLVDDYGNILLEDFDFDLDTEEGKMLFEAFKRAFKRLGTKIVRKFRCTSGKRAGRIVSNPTLCNKAIDPTRRLIGKRASRMKQGSRRRKSKITMRKSIHKKLTRLNR